MVKNVIQRKISSQSLSEVENNNIPKNWKLSNIGQVCNILPGFGFPKNFQGDSTGEFAFYKVGDISKNVKSGNRYLEFCENYISSIILKKIKAKPFPQNTIVFAKIGEALKLNRRAIIKIPGIVDNNAVGLKAKEEICIDLFLYYFLNTVKLEDYSRATTVPSVRKSDIEEIPFPLPPIKEQLQIVTKLEELFSELEKGIESLKLAQQQLKVYRQAVLKWAFEGRLTNGNVKEGKLPEGWKWVQSGSLFEFVTSGSRGWAKYYSDAGSIFVRITNLNFDSLELDLEETKIKYVKPPSNTEGTRTKIQEGDFLISITGYLGMFAIAPKLSSAYINQHISLCRPNKSVHRKYFGYWIISKSGGYKYLNRMTKGATKAGLGLDDIKSFPVPMAPIEERETIVQAIENRLSVVDKAEESINQSLQQTEVMRQSILKRAFDGNL